MALYDNHDRNSQQDNQFFESLETIKKNPPYLAVCPMCGAVPKLKVTNDIYGLRARIECPSCEVVLHSHIQAQLPTGYRNLLHDGICEVLRWLPAPCAEEKPSWRIGLKDTKAEQPLNAQNAD